MPDDRQFCTFLVDGYFFGIEVLRVQEVIRFQEMTRVPLASPVIQGLINLRGQIVTAIDLRRGLELSDRPQGSLPMNVVVRTSDGAVSLLVDEIGDVVNVDAEKFERPPETISGVTRKLVSGVYKLPERLLLVMDTDKTVNLSGVAA
jgi:purine-binding chemotaxis protein CheW